MFDAQVSTHRYFNVPVTKKVCSPRGRVRKGTPIMGMALRGNVLVELSPDAPGGWKRVP